MSAFVPVYEEHAKKDWISQGHLKMVEHARRHPAFEAQKAFH